MKNRALVLAGFLFAFMALVHFFRLFYPFEVNIDGWLVPIWFDVIAFLIAGTLSGLMFRALKDERSQNRKGQ